MADEHTPKAFPGNKTRVPSNAERVFMKYVEDQNNERVRKLKIVRRRNLVTAGVLVASVLSIYGYSMYAVQQEKFLDDFNEPQKTTQ